MKTTLKRPLSCAPALLTVIEKNGKRWLKAAGLLAVLAGFLLTPPLGTMSHLLPSGSQGPGGTFLVFGPADYMRTNGKPVAVTRNFSTRNPNSQYTLRIFNGGRNGQFGRSSSAIVTLNGVEVARPNDFNQNVSLIERPVTLSAQNTLIVELRSAPGSGVTIEIVGIDLDTPTVQISFPANGATLNTTQVTVMGTAGDATSGIIGVTCNGVAANLSGVDFTCDLELNEGANTIVGRATDAAGNVATASITVTVVTNSVQVVVPRLQDVSQRFAEAAIAAAHLAVGSINTTNSDRLPAGYVLSHSPAYGTVVSSGSRVNLVISSGPSNTTPPLSFAVDTSITPPFPTLPAFPDGVPRPLGSIVDNHNKQANFVENELLLMTDDTTALNAFIARWQGTRLLTTNPSDFGMNGLSRMHLVRINTSLADASTLVTRLRGITPFGQGEHRVSSQSALQLLAAAARESANGLLAVVNWVGSGHDFRNRTTTEAGTCSNCTSYSANAYNWSFMNTTSPPNIAVTEAWTALQKTGKLNNKIQLAILDMGFAPNADFPPDLVAFSNLDIVPNPPLNIPSLLGCNGLFDCPWHGTNVLGAAMGVANNNFGGAGPAGPVAQPIVIYTLYDHATSIAAVGEAALLGADIINMSYGWRVPALLSWTVIPFDLATLIARNVTGILIFASAGNDGEDVDATDGFIIEWEEGWYTPCENGGVDCVGGLARGTKSRASNSNYGKEEVDIFAPYTVWVGPDPGSPTGQAREVNGTSYSSPYAAGVAALIWAANPNLSADDVERLMFDRAHRSDDLQDLVVEKRYVNAYDAVIDALGGNAPPNISIVSPLNGSSHARGTVNVAFAAFVNDREDPAPTVVWRSNLPSGDFGSGPRIERDDLKFGAHTITATVTDSGGFTDTESITVTIVNDQPPTVTISDPADRLVLPNSQGISFTGTSSDPNNIVRTSGDPVPSFKLPDADVTWHLDGATAPFATGHSASIGAGALTPGMHAVTFFGVDTAVPSTVPYQFTSADVISFTIQPSGPLPGQPPAVTISDPATNAKFSAGPITDTLFAANVVLQGAATDPESGAIPNGRLIWTTRKAGGAEETLGIGSPLTAQLFTQGFAPETEHLITLYATDNVGNIASQTIRILVVFPDADMDGLSYDRELMLGTDPFNPDTDGDGVWDGAEVFLNTLPLSNTSKPTLIPTNSLFASISQALGGATLSLLDFSNGNFGVLGRPNDGLGFGLAINRAGFLFVSRFTTLSIDDPFSGASTNIGAFRTAVGTPINISHIAFDPADNLLYGVEEGPAPNFLPTGQLVRIDPTNAICTRIGNGANNPRLNALSFNTSGVLFAAAEGDAASDRLVELSPVTGAVVRDIGPIGFAPVYGLTFNQAGALLASNRVSNRESRLLMIDLNNGTGAVASMIERAVFGLAFMPCPAPCFDPPINTAVGGILMSVAVADLNADGKQDLVAADRNDRIVLLHGNGNGTFQPALSFPIPNAGASPIQIAVADLNGDIRPDVVTANGDQTVSVFLNNGAGGFLPAATVGAGGFAPSLRSIAIGDATGDGIPDIVAGVFTTVPMVSLLAGDGSGGFGTPVMFPASQFSIRSLAVGDLDGDTHLDVATAHSDGRIVVTYGPLSATGGSAQLVIPNPGAPTSIVIRDLNNDGGLDIAVSDLECRCVAVLFKNGARSFSPPAPFQVGIGSERPVGLATGELTGDGRADLVTANDRANSFSVLVGIGTAFRTAVRSPFAVGGGVTAVATGDLNGDGLLDAVAVTGNGSVWVLLNRRSL